jgi:folate-binding protein YgfZ
MTDLKYTILEDRGILSISGEDSNTFLQGLVSNDVEKVTDEQAAYGALLTPQGKFLYDFFMARRYAAILVDSESARLDGLTSKLKMYKLRSKVDLKNITDEVSVVALYGSDVLSRLDLEPTPGSSRACDGGMFFTDPRVNDMGARAILPKNLAQSIVEELGFSKTSVDSYETLRISLGLPDGSRDMIVEKAILLENGFDELNGVDWNKGCFIGQELTARTKHRGLIKKRLIPVHFEVAPPPTGTPIMVGDKEAGEIRSVSDEHGLALIRLEHLENPKAIFLANGIRLTPQKPLWAKF